MNDWNTIFLPPIDQVRNATQSLFSVPVYEISDPEDQYGYVMNNVAYVPRWVFLLQFKAAGNHFKALELLEQRTNEVLDRRLKEINL